ncbi:hypothetical protein [Streptomyces flavofungini]|uniref:Uncharacterized protein n=1 Tax=Streptomyces flavofungini TaxID=68200 RepID=A0ABS0XGH5_9ACTN|nr:hypothetical protein [Streptomyces flavofungini]MBJ3812319.1 hypothetical protein [Streptomyces flavofungini]GHC88474.1 hypothetical protein GCM10010349_75780 [Streptomyces flavofungini]
MTTSQPVLTNGARIVDEWLPVKNWSTASVREWRQDAPVTHHWTYDSAPGTGDWGGTSRARVRCACSPPSVTLFWLFPGAHGDTFRADWRIADLTKASREPTAPVPSVVCPDTGPDMELLGQQVRTALRRPPRKEVELAAGAHSACDGCS